MPFELFVALRYLKSKRKGLFSLVTTVIGVAGVSIGVAALVVILSVMNGFQTDIRAKIIGAQSHLTVSGRLEEGLGRAEEALKRAPEVVAFSPFVLDQAIMTYRERSSGVVVKGIDPEREFKVNDLGKNLTHGSWEGLAGAPSLVLGEELARSLGAWVGDTVVLISPHSLSTPFGIVPAMKKFKVIGVLKTGYYEYDASTAYTSLKTAADFFKTPGGASGLQARLTDLDLAEPVARRLQTELGFDFSVRSFSDMNRTLFAALKLEKYMMFIIVTLIVLVASFNIASNLILMGSEKLRDIGLLRAMGAAPATVLRVFLWVGSLIGAGGVLAGLALGLALCWVVHRFPIVELPADVYYLSRLPVRVDPLDVLAIAACGALLSVLATLYPAYRASRVDPIEAIHYG